MAAEPTQQAILSLRNRFTQECMRMETKPDQRDITMVESDDNYVRNFLVHTLGNENEAFQFLVDCVKWRKEFGIHDLSARGLDDEIVRSGVCYIRGRDREGNPCIVVNTRLHKKDPEKLPRAKQQFVFLLEDQRLREPTMQVTVIFNMTDTGLGNMDMEFTRFVIDCFKFYFPNMLNVILVFEMPFILQTVWRIIKGWLSERAQAKIKFVKGSQIQTYIDPDQLLRELGGRDSFTFDPDEFYRLHSPPSLEDFGSVMPDDADHSVADLDDVGNGNTDSVASTSSATAGSVTDGAAKRVRWADPQAEKSSPRSSLHRQDSSSDSTTQQQRQAHVHNLLQQRDSANGSLRRRNPSTAGLLEISPSSVMEFRNTGADDVAVPVTLQNVSTNTVGFKVKTTGPDRYHVRPSAGIIPTGASAVANVTLRSGSDVSMISHDKFLVEFCPVPPTLQPSELSKFWRSVDRSGMHEKILRTQLVKASKPAKSEPSATDSSRGGDQAAGTAPGLADMQRTIADLSAKVEKLERTQRQLVRKSNIVTDLAYVLLSCLLVVCVALALQYYDVFHYDLWLFKK